MLEKDSSCFDTDDADLYMCYKNETTTYFTGVTVVSNIS